MRGERLFRILGLVDAELIEEAVSASSPAAVQRRTLQRRALAGAARTTLGGAYCSYTGPIFPLTVLNSPERLTAERAIIWDFFPSASRDGASGQWNAAVTDEYILSNATDKELSLTALYPLAGSLHELSVLSPMVTVDGAKAETLLYVGCYVGGFQNACGGQSHEPLNSRSLNSWMDYKILLTDGHYLEQTLAAALEPGHPTRGRYPLPVDGRPKDIFSEALHQKRVLYLSFSITMPASGSIVVTAQIQKTPSYDFGGRAPENSALQVYDLVTQLGSALTFTKQTSALNGIEGIQVIRQNFGFDLKADITQVELDVKQEHYYLHLRPRRDKRHISLFF